MKDTAPLTCLLVDDLDANLLALSQLVRRDDVNVLLAHSGEEALELLLQHEVALALIDVQMPHMDGVQLAEIMRSSDRTRGIPIIFVTAGAHDHSRMFKGYEAGAVDYLYKPVEPHILRNKVDVFFELSRQRLQLRRDLRERTETLRLHELFTAVLGHDLRNPLGAITMAAETIARRTSDSDAGDRAKGILQSAQAMNRLIKDMLDLARARLGDGIFISRQLGDFCVIVRRAVEEMRTRFPSKTIDLRISGDMRGEWDPDRMSQVIVNLVGNAIQHGADDRSVVVELEGDKREFVEFAVENAGEVPHELRSSMFNPFRTALPSSGLGLGLYIAQEIVVGHGGSITVEHLSGPRTRFIVTVPRMQGSTQSGDCDSAKAVTATPPVSSTVAPSVAQDTTQGGDVAA